MRQRHWLGFLKDYDLTILYYLGKANIVSDALSLKLTSMGRLAYLLIQERLLALEI